jgi:hypothetical protein
MYRRWPLGTEEIVADRLGWVGGWVGVGVGRERVYRGWLGWEEGVYSKRKQ